MDHINRLLFDQIKIEIQRGGKIIVVYGARQTGKTTLCKRLIAETGFKVLAINADEVTYHDVLSSRDLQKIKLLVAGYDLVFIDEAQRIPDIGINLKIIHDQMPDIRLLVTGSSSIDLAGGTKEALTGRTSSHLLYPISLIELKNSMNVVEMKSRLHEFLVYGMYPVVFQYPDAANKEKYLRELTSAYLYKDVLGLSGIRNTTAITKLLKLLALQIGSEVSLNELAKNIGIAQETVNHYIDLLEQSFILFRLGGYSRNLRKEISKRYKIYFWDTGVRNALLNNFSDLSSRTDTGPLWENFVIAERLKKQAYTQSFIVPYFWRLYTGSEIDYIEDRNGQLSAFEIKTKCKRTTAPKSWVENYGNNFECVDMENFYGFLL